MKRIYLTVEFKYKDGRKDDYFFDRGELDPFINCLMTDKLSSYIKFEHIDFVSGDIEIEGGEIIHSGTPYIKEESFCTVTVCHTMKDDEVPCNEDTLFLQVECSNSYNHKRQTIDLPYREGESVVMDPYPYQIKILKTNGEEVEVEVTKDDSVFNYCIQLYNHISRNDKWSYATGNPNDPVDTTGPSLYIYLLRK